MLFFVHVAEVAGNGTTVSRPDDYIDDSAHNKDKPGKVYDGLYILSHRSAAYHH